MRFSHFREMTPAIITRGRPSTWIVPPLVLSLALLAGGCDGGARGSGITTVDGDVAGADATSRLDGGRGGIRTMLAGWSHLLSLASAEADSTVEGIAVRVEGRGVEGRTDADGHFRLRGRFGGLETLRFESPDGEAADLTINVPAGGTLTLVHVGLDYARGAASAERQDVVFDGRIVSADCDAGSLTLESRESPDDGDVYLLDLDDSSLERSNGAPVACADLQGGERVHVEAGVNEDQSYGSATVVLEN